MAELMIRQSFYWLDFISSGQNAAQWVSDIPAQTDMSYRLILPPWFPRQTRLCHVWVGYGVASGPVGPTEVWCLMDPKGINYASGNPPGAENDATMGRLMTLAYQYQNTGIQNMQGYQIDPPILFDRDANDKLWFGLAGNDPIAWAWMNLSFLQETVA